MVRRSSSQPIKFMVIDDSRVIREQIEHILRGENYRFVGACRWCRNNSTHHDYGFVSENISRFSVER